LDVKSRYPCSGVAPVVVFHSVVGSGSVDPARATPGIGEGAVLAGAVVADRVGADEFLTDGDLHRPLDDSDLDLAATELVADPIRGAGEAHIA
jgi:hypothetical protein